MSVILTYNSPGRFEARKVPPKYLSQKNGLSDSKMLVLYFEELFLPLALDHTRHRV